MNFNVDEDLLLDENMNDVREDEDAEITLDMEWVEILQNRVVETKWDDLRTVKSTIFRVPKHLRDNDPKAYDPVCISLGPYHRHEKRLQAMDNLKWHYLKKFLDLDPNKSLADYLKLMKKLESQARIAYSEDIVDMNSNDFVLMLLLDGCFVLWTIKSWMSKEGELEQVQNPIKSTVWAVSMVARDMLALENQLPFLILECLYDFANFHGRFSISTSLAELTFRFFDAFLDDLEIKMPSNTEAQFHHLLHLVHSCIIPPENQDGGESSTGSRWPLLKNMSSSNLHHYFSLCMKKLHCYGSKGEENDNNFVELIPTATQLMEFGVHLKRKKNAASILDITFKNGNLEIPHLTVDDNTNKIFRNLVAFEQCNEDVNQHFTLYSLAMNCIIDTATDVVLLQDAGIISNNLGDSKEVAKFFNNLGTEVCFNNEGCYLSDVFTRIKNHNGKKYNKWRARLNHDYFSNPWAIVSVFAAIFLFVLTITQTTYTVLAYLHSP
ncbi:hypothetical protein Cni_G15136 [Canna indica]|uniref:Uncharacterized protein n=1 Tax=Canna indica TaxID=4628 RepID=A0AAQ3KDA8_9LILI|nr:hypothetical protein Cni_G15136 [Canna indica]